MFFIDKVQIWIILCYLILHKISQIQPIGVQQILRLAFLLQILERRRSFYLAVKHASCIVFEVHLSSSTPEMKKCFQQIEIKSLTIG